MPSFKTLRRLSAIAIVLAATGAGAGPAGAALLAGATSIAGDAAGSAAPVPSLVSGAAQPSLAAVSGAGVGAIGPPGHGQGGPSVVHFNRETYQYRSNSPLSRQADRYQFIVLMANEYQEIPRLRAQNPNLKFLLYQAIMFTNSQDIPWLQTNTGCTPYSTSAATEPSWFLHDQEGRPVIAPHSSGLYAMDVGNPAYQQACASNAAAVAKRYGFDGIFFDVVEGRLAYTLRPGISVPEYPTQLSWESAMNSALAYLAPAMHAQGLLAFGNVGDASSEQIWKDWVSHLDGVEEESWTNGGKGLAQQAPFWHEKLSEAKWAAANGKYELVHSHSTGQIANTYGLASMLLAADGRTSYSTSTKGYGSQTQWFPEYGTAGALGAPAGGDRVLANGVYERAFSRGIVLANPSLRAVRPFSLGGDRYSGSGLNNVQAVRLPPTSGLILLETGRGQ